MNRREEDEVTYVTEDVVDQHARMQNEMQGNTDDQSEPKDYWALDIPEMIEQITGTRENVQVTLFHRYLYEQDNPRILRAIHEKLTRKLAFMGIAPVKYKSPKYDERSFEYACNQFEQGNEKFYANKSSERDFNSMEQ